MGLKPELGPTLKTFTSYDGPIQSMNFKIYCATVDYSWTNSSSKKKSSSRKNLWENSFIFIYNSYPPPFFSHLALVES